MQKTEHIERFHGLIEAVLAKPVENQAQMEYWSGARDMLAWVLQDPAEYFDPRVMRRIAELTDHALREAYDAAHR